jgi:rod shape-determining protein MreD
VKFLKFLIVVLPCVFLQASFFDLLTIAGIRPDAVLSVVVFHALAEGPRFAVFTGFLSGLLLDLYEPHRLGTNALGYAGVAWLLGYARGRVYREQALMTALLVVLGGLILEAMRALLLIRGDANAFGYLILRFGLPSALYSGILSLPLFFILNRFIGEKVKR